MTEDPEQADVTSAPGRDEATENRDVRDAMASYATEGQGDDETGGDAAAGAATDPGESTEDDREPHGPA